jgi:RNA polymerase sigma-70 factor (ECF subfamily)
MLLQVMRALPVGFSSARVSSVPDVGADFVAPPTHATQFVDGRPLTPSCPTRMSLTAATDASDLEIVARLIAGDERALGALYDRYGGVAFSLACAIVHDPTDAEDVVADTFSQIWRTVSSFDATRGSVVAWVSTIVRTRSLDLIRAQKRRARILDEVATVSDETSAPGLSSGGPSPDRGVEVSDAQRLVRRSLAELPASQRLVLELAYFGGLSQSEIAERLSEPLGTVKTRMRSGMEKLRQALAPLTESHS